MGYELDTFTCNHCQETFSRTSNHTLHYIKYGYFNGDAKHPYEWKQCETCAQTSWIQKRRSFCSYKCSKTGSENPQWKGPSAGYLALHARVYRERGGAVDCAFGDHAGPYEWANLLGDYPDVADYTSMCVPCHRNYDQAVAKCFDKVCKRGHILNNSTMYVKIRNGKEVRQCKQCAKDRAKERRRNV